jgi:hypothetical protein
LVDDTTALIVSVGISLSLFALYNEQSIQDVLAYDNINKFCAALYTVDVLILWSREDRAVAIGIREDFGFVMIRLYRSSRRFFKNVKIRAKDENGFIIVS